MTALTSWRAMKTRCYNKNQTSYENYGGRGISVCERWLDSFENFYEDMGEPPVGSYSIDRIDNNGNYSPENCKWSTTKQQARNKRNTVRYNIDGVEKSLREWCEDSGVKYQTAYMRITRQGWDAKEAIFTKASLYNNGAYRKYILNGESLSLTEISERCKISYATLWKRINHYGMTLQQAVSLSVTSGGNAAKERNLT